MSPIYFDNNATAPPAPAVLAAMQECLLECWGNPSSRHRIGASAKDRLALARTQVATLIGAAPAAVMFAGSASEANQTAIRGALAMSDGRRHVVASAVEHPSTLLMLRHLQATGVDVTLIGVDGDGRLDLTALEAAITDETALVSLMWANNETGVLYPVKEAAQLAKSRGALFHTDAVQAAGRVAIDVKAMAPDFLTISGHKLHAAKGVGALYVRKGLSLPPLVFGHQERGRRGGTENVAAIAGMGVAAEQAARRMEQTAPAVLALRERFERGLLQRLPQARVNGAGAPRLPNTSSIRLGLLDAQVVLELLDRAGICAGSGSACMAGGNLPSHVLLAMGLSEPQALATLRISLSRYNRADEVDTVLEALVAIAAAQQERAA